MTPKLPPKTYLLSRLEYNEASGKLFWKTRAAMQGADRMLKSWNTRYAGKEAGCLSFDALGKPRSVVVQLLFPDNKKRLVYAHRIILKMMSKLKDETLEVDHIDGNPFNNRLENLRVCSHLQNGQNLGFSRYRKRSEATRHLPMGVHRRRSKYAASITIRLQGIRKRLHLGTFSSPEEAHRAYIRASYKFRGAFARKQNNPPV